MKIKNRKKDENGKKSVLRFRDYEAIEDEDFDHVKKRRRDVGKRLHRQKAPKVDHAFWGHE